MNTLLTPMPVFFKNNRGVKSAPEIARYQIPLLKTTLRSYELPQGAIIISGQSEYYIQFRAVWDKQRFAPAPGHGWCTYHQITAYTGTNCLEYQGMAPCKEAHDEFHETFNIILPIATQIYKRLRTQAAA